MLPPNGLRISLLSAQRHVIQVTVPGDFRDSARTELRRGGKSGKSANDPGLVFLRD